MAATLQQADVNISPFLFCLPPSPRPTIHTPPGKLLPGPNWGPSLQGAHAQSSGLGPDSSQENRLPLVSTIVLDVL